MKKLAMLLILLTIVLFTAGCTGETSNSSNAQGSQERIPVEEINNLEQINESLKTGPVFLKIGASYCGPCREMQPMLEELAAQYEGKVTVLSADIDNENSTDLASYFDIGYVPDSSIIIGIENGEYVYMQEDGNISKDRMKARILGLREKSVYENTLNHAILQNEK
ncbi:MAG: thioredoxin domain-containing protein [Methanosarcina sp.]